MTKTLSTMYSQICLILTIVHLKRLYYNKYKGSKRTFIGLVVPSTAKSLGTTFSLLKLNKPYIILNIFNYIWIMFYYILFHTRGNVKVIFI